jgi:hypothetical protein
MSVTELERQYNKCIRTLRERRNDIKVELVKMRSGWTWLMIMPRRVI